MPIYFFPCCIHVPMDGGGGRSSSSSSSSSSSVIMNGTTPVPGSTGGSNSVNFTIIVRESSFLLSLYCMTWRFPYQQCRSKIEMRACVRVWRSVSTRTTIIMLRIAYG